METAITLNRIKLKLEEIESKLKSFRERKNETGGTDGSKEERRYPLSY